MNITNETGIIELTPIDRNGAEIYQAARSYLYPKDNYVLNLDTAGKIALCFIDGMEIYHFRKEVSRVDVTIKLNPIKVETPIGIDREFTQEELYLMYKASIDDQKRLSEELKELKDSIDDLEYAALEI